MWNVRWIVKVVMEMNVSLYGYEGVTNQEDRGEDMVDKMSQEVDFRGEMMHIEMSDLWFLQRSAMQHVVSAMIDSVRPSVCLSVRLSVTVRYHVKTTQATIMGSSL